MSKYASVFRQVLNEHPELLTQIRRGVEKESLRVTEDQATLAQTQHPAALGSALTHPAITTDYSEALLEFITPAESSIDATEQSLADLHRFTARQLDKELLWNASMPCIVSGDAEIPIAQFGQSNVGQMKRIYRNGLSVRYGRKMQAIAGLHYNFSLPLDFWSTVQEHVEPGRDPMQLQTDGYLSLIRNFFSRAWVLLYLLGASPTVCASFVQGNRNHHLKPMGDDHHSYYLPYATSLRMGDLGYTSNAQADLNVCYNDLGQYISTLRNAILTPHQAYQDFTFMDNGEPAQLNDSLLQIENEYYSPIRPKRVTESGEAPIAALGRNGIEYIEVRCVDINPFIPYGIDADTMRLLDLFLMSCLIDDSPLCDEAGQKRNEINLQRMINRGREPDLTLLSASGIETPMQLLAQPVLERMAEIAEWFTSEDSADDYRRVAAEAGQKFADPDRTLSARMLREMAESGLSYSQLALRYSRQWHAQHLSDPLSEAASTRLKIEAEQSIHRQHAIESQDSEAFEDYLRSFYQQYQSSDA